MIYVIAYVVIGAIMFGIDDAVFGWINEGDGEFLVVVSVFWPLRLLWLFAVLVFRLIAVILRPLNDLGRGIGSDLVERAEARRFRRHQRAMRDQSSRYYIGD